MRFGFHSFETNHVSNLLFLGMYKKFLAHAGVCLLLSQAGTAVCRADTLREPITIASENGVLDLLMIARAAPVETLYGAPTGWVYEICKRPANGVNTCPKPQGSPNYYGGTLLQLQKGDRLKIHLVNQLPPALDSDHALEPGHEFLAMNPTNLHTHGMLVAPRKATAADPTFGDNVFVLTFNSANGKPALSPHMHSEIRYDSTDYDIKVPASHPSGLFWFHPHAHGLSLNQITVGLSGIITVGDISDYFCGDPGCRDYANNVTVRHMILKDTQILPDASLQDQEDPPFCKPNPAPGDAPRQGFCQGQDLTDSDGKIIAMGGGISRSMASLIRRSL